MIAAVRFHRAGDCAAERAFLLDRHYVVRDGEIVIVDEFTGRMSEGRKWRDGLHQAIEAKENVEMTIDTGHAARVTVQDYFLRYPYLAGMTGTASNSARELYRIYKLRVVPIPTNRPPIRQRLPDQIFGTAEAKNEAIVREVSQIHAAGRPILIGTRSIDKSEVLSRLLSAAASTHQVLNARQVALEAEIIAAAGRARQSHRFDEHGRPRNRHPARRRRCRLGRAARYSHRNARLRPHRSAVDWAVAAGKAIRAATANSSPSTTIFCWPGWAGQIRAPGRAWQQRQPAPSTSLARLFRKAHATSSAATSAIAGR